MNLGIVSYALQYAGYAAELGIIFYALRRGHARRLWAVIAYVTAMLATDLARSYVLFHYGLSSRQFATFYYVSDALLVIGAFLLVCLLFRAACEDHPNLWHSLRFFLATVLVLVLGVSLLSLSENYAKLFPTFIVEFQQNLYFTCLVLNTLLYILMTRIESADEQLSLVVVGLGLQFAAPAANFALMYLTGVSSYAESLFAYLSPLCTLGMLLIWLYAVARVPARAPESIQADSLRRATRLAASEVLESRP
jgi:hypothetical protein